MTKQKLLALIEEYAEAREALYWYEDRGWVEATLEEKRETVAAVKERLVQAVENFSG